MSWAARRHQRTIGELSSLVHLYGNTKDDITCISSSTTNTFPSDPSHQPFIFLNNLKYFCYGNARLLYQFLSCGCDKISRHKVTRGRVYFGLLFQRVRCLVGRKSLAMDRNGIRVRKLRTHISAAYMTQEIRNWKRVQSPFDNASLFNICVFFYSTFLGSNTFPAFFFSSSFAFCISFCPSGDKGERNQK